jgi:pyruvate formate lyase activating enzyme
MLEKPATSAQSLIKAKEIAAAAGLKYVYLGNIAIDGASDTTCPKCGKLLIERLGYQTRTIGLDKNNNGIVRCLFCGEDINIVL